MVCWGFMAEAGGTPCMLTSRRGLAGMSRSVWAASLVVLKGGGWVRPYV